jgi:transposase-like protein
MKQTRRSWSEEESAAIKNLAGKVSLKEIARQLDRSESATRVQAWKLGVKSTVVGQAHRRDKRPNQTKARSVEQIVAPAAIERALSIYEQLQQRDHSVILQARKILTQHIYGMVDRGECDEQRLTVGGLIHLKAVERDHAIKSAHDAPAKSQKRNANV